MKRNSIDAQNDLRELPGVVKPPTDTCHKCTDQVMLLHALVVYEGADAMGAAMVECPLY